jgi:hypothetical protein
MKRVLENEPLSNECISSAGHGFYTRRKRNSSIKKESDADTYILPRQCTLGLQSMQIRITEILISIASMTPYSILGYTSSVSVVFQSR